METLFIKDKPKYFIRFGIGVLMTIAGVAIFIADSSNVHFKDYILFAFFVLAGIANMTNDFGISKTYFKITDKTIVIKLYNKIKSRSFSASDISEITLHKSLIRIELKNGKFFKIRLNLFRLPQKTQIYNFMIHYAKENEITLKRLPLENNMSIQS